MSGWNTYVASVIGHSRGSCDKACVIGLDGGVWTYGEATILNVSADEAKKISTTFRENKCQEFQANGVTVEGIKYQFLRDDDNVIYAKKKGHGCLTLQKTKQGIVIAHTAEGQQHGDVNLAVAKICDHLEQSGY